MERTQRITSPQSLDDLAAQAESALDEIDALRKRSAMMRSFPDRPESGDAVYDDDADILYIYNETRSEWKAH